MAKKQRFLEGIAPVVAMRYPERQKEIMEAAQMRCQALLTENAGESKAVAVHTHGRIYPAISVFYAMTEAGVSREDAAQTIYAYYTGKSRKMAGVYQKLCKIPGLYKTIPAVFRIGIKKMFGADAGFKAQYHATDSKCFRVDMLECPYKRICDRYGCPEIVPAFCTSDDVAYGNMHPKLIWARTKTLGRGDDCCDFNLFIRSEK